MVVRWRLLTTIVTIHATQWSTEYKRWSAPLKRLRTVVQMDFDTTVYLVLPAGTYSLGEFNLIVAWLLHVPKDAKH